MEIKNTFQLITEDLNENQLLLRRIGLRSLEIAISAVKPKNLMNISIRTRGSTLIIKGEEFDLRKFKRIYIIGGGKATAEMALSFEEILVSLNDIDYEGIINIPKGSEKFILFKNSKISINPGSHPIPDDRGLEGTKSMIKLIEQSNKNDLIFCLISGGGSALLPLPANNISIDDLKSVNAILLASGASIHEINTIRKHISKFKGGNLAKRIHISSGATIISLIISDVVGDDLDIIASGPTVPDTTTFKDALEIIKKYNIYEKIPQTIVDYIEKGLQDIRLENPKPNDKCFEKVHNYLIGSVKSAVDAIISYLGEQGFITEYFSNTITGEAREFGKSLYNIISQRISGEFNKLALIGTGELTVTIQGKGIGGRNQEMLLSFLNYIKELNVDYNFLIIGANLDGIEGNSQVMGALIDNFTFNQMNIEKIDPVKYLNNNDSNNFFKILNSEIITGPTGCNVNDIVIVLISKDNVKE